MNKSYENGTVVKLDNTPARLNTLRTIGTGLPFDDFIIFLKFEKLKMSHFDKARYYLLDLNFCKTKVTELDVKILAKNEQVLILNQSQFRPLIQYAIEDNENIARLNKSICELIYKIGFMNEKEFASIKFH